MVYSDIDDASVSDTTIIPAINRETMKKLLKILLMQVWMKKSSSLVCNTLLSTDKVT